MTESKRGESSSDFEAQRHYSGYEDWKGWDNYFTYSDEEGEYFEGEMRGIALSGNDVLEIGFGSGSFLAWAKDAGAKIAGTEISDRSHTEAKKHDVELLSADVENIAHEHKGRFDVIVAFDVFEHFSLDEIAMRIRAIDMMLRPGGYLVLRFPNGQSPFGLGPQNADITHKEALSKDKVEQICHKFKWRSVRYSGSYGIRGSFGIRYLVRRFRYLVRDLIGGVLNSIYSSNIPWDAVVVLVLQKPNIEK